MDLRSHSVNKCRKRRKEKLVIAMGGKCQCCNYSTTFSALQVHHINPKDKSADFSKLTQHNHNLIDYKEELEKCILLCANCHREVHEGILEIPENYQRFDLSLIEPKVKVVKLKKKRTSKLKISTEELEGLLKTSTTNIELGKQLGVSNSYISRLRKELARRDSNLQHQN